MAETLSTKCSFESVYEKECVKSTKGLVESNGTKRIISIIEASKKYNDDLHISLESKLLSDPNLTVYYHKNCVSRYTSKSNLVKYGSISDEEEPPRKLRKSDCHFNFREHCLYCGESCQLEKDPKNPIRWRAAFLCRSTYSELENKPYKEYLIEKCTARNDQWANKVLL